MPKIYVTTNCERLVMHCSSILICLCTQKRASYPVTSFTWACERKARRTSIGEWLGSAYRFSAVDLNDYVGWEWQNNGHLYEYIYLKLLTIISTAKMKHKEKKKFLAIYNKRWLGLKHPFDRDARNILNVIMNFMNLIASLHRNLWNFFSSRRCVKSKSRKCHE